MKTIFTKEELVQDQVQGIRSGELSQEIYNNIIQLDLYCILELELTKKNIN